MINFSKLKKLLALSLAGLMIFSATACGETDPYAAYKDMTVLEIGNVDAGLGDEWINAVKTEFEKAFADYEGVDGKKGVYVGIENKTTEFSTPQLVINMPTNPHDIYILANSSYQTLINADVLADVTDVLTAKNYDANGDLLTEGSTVSEDDKTSIASRMVDFYENYYNMGTADNPLYYGIPFFSTPTGAIYDADFFDAKKLYMNKTGQFACSQADVDSGKAGVGPDGIPNTYDDGLPETYEQFKQLCSTIKTRANGIPFIFDTQHVYQRDYALKQVWANYEGANDYMLNFSLSGHDNDLNVDINDTNGYELIKQPGRLAMYTYAKDIISKGWYDTESYVANVSHTGAQSVFLNSVESDARIAFLFEGSWWENESREAFAEMAEYHKNDNYAYGKRNFKLLPMPRFVGTQGIADQINTRQVLTCSSAGNSMICVNKSSDKLDLALEFIKFMHSRQMLALMSQTSSCLRPFEYSMTDKELQDSTTFFNSIYTMWKSDKVDVVYDVTTSQKIAGNPTYFDDFYIYNEPFSYFIGNATATASSLYSSQTALFKSTDKVWNSK